LPGVEVVSIVRQPVQEVVVYQVPGLPPQGLSERWHVFAKQWPLISASTIDVAIEGNQDNGTD